MQIWHSSLSPIASWAALVAETRSPSPDDNAIVACFFDDQEITLDQVERCTH